MLAEEPYAAVRSDDALHNPSEPRTHKLRVVHQAQCSRARLVLSATALVMLSAVVFVFVRLGAPPAHLAATGGGGTEI